MNIWMNYGNISDKIYYIIKLKKKMGIKKLEKMQKEHQKEYRLIVHIDTEAKNLYVLNSEWKKQYLLKI